MTDRMKRIDDAIALLLSRKCDRKTQEHFTTRLGKASAAQRSNEETTIMEIPNEANDDVKLAALEFFLRAHRGIDQLQANRKFRACEYAERIKKLKQIAQAIGQRDQMGTLALDGLNAISLSEEDIALVHNPLQGL